MRRVTDEDLRTLEAIADLAAVACRNAEAFEQRQPAARTDSLTGLLNHGALQVRVREEICARPPQRRRRSSCLLLDLDNFKPSTTSTATWPATRSCSASPRRSRPSSAPYDGVARYGGDEFVVLLPGTDEDEAREAAERLRAAVTAAASSAGASPLRRARAVGGAARRRPSCSTRRPRAAAGQAAAARAGRRWRRPRRARARLTRRAAPARPALMRATSGTWSPAAAAARRARDPARLPAPRTGAGGGRAVRARAAWRAGPSGSARLAARAPGDPGAHARFTRARLVPPAAELRASAWRSGPISRGSLAELLAALGRRGHGADRRRAAGGSYAAIALARAGRLHGLLVLRTPSRRVPAGAACAWPRSLAARR